MSKYYIAYEENIPWNGSVFNANEYRRALNSFYSKIDLVKPNAITDDDAPVPNFTIKNLSPDATFPNELGFNLSGTFSTSKRDELTGKYLASVNLSGDVKVPRQSASGKNLKVIIATAYKNVIGVGKTPSEAFDNAFKQLRESLLQTLADQLGGKGIKVERQEPFTDPDPALPGPPTQSISGVTNKAPVVDNPNIKLPTQEVKSLSATSANDAVGQVKSSATSTITQAQGSVSGLASQAQGAASGAVSQAQGSVSGLTSQVQSNVGGTISDAKNTLNKAQDSISNAQSSATSKITSEVDKLNPKGLTPDGLGKNWSPDKFSPSSIAGNDKFVDPKTGLVGSTSKLAKAAGSGVLGGAVGAGIGALAGGGQGALIGGLGGAATGVGLSIGGVAGGALAGGGLGAGIGGLTGGPQGALIGGGAGVALGAAAAKLASIKKTMPKPKIPKPPSVPRIKTVKIPRPDSTKGAEQLLNLSKLT